MNPYDNIHSVSSDFRKLLNAMSHPARIYDFKQSSWNKTFPNNPLFFRFSQIVLDNEVSAFSNFSDKDVEYVFKLTRVKRAVAHDADYLFLDGHLKESLDIFKIAKSGDLINPEKSATLFIRIKKIEEKQDFIIRGPGIKDQTSLSFGKDNVWLEACQSLNHEFPLGIDCVFYDEDDNAISILRTTQIQKGR